MFGMFKKKKNQVEELIENDGFEHATKRFSEIILSKCENIEIAKQFILEEIEAASQGNTAAMAFAKDSGFKTEEYIGAMNNSRPEVDNPDGPQQFLLYLTSNLKSDIDLMVKFRTTIVDNIMKTCQLGKYSAHDKTDSIMLELKELLEKDGLQEAIMMSQVTGQVSLEFSADIQRITELTKELEKSQAINEISSDIEDKTDDKDKNERLISLVEKIENSEHGAFLNINNDLDYFIEENEDCDPLINMAYGYARRYAAAGMYAQGLIDNNTYNHVFSVFKGIQVDTGGYSKEFQIAAAEQAIEYMKSYSNELNDQIIQFTLYLVENGLHSPLARGETYDFKRIMWVINQLMSKKM